MAFSDADIEAVWKKGTTVEGNAPADWRKDQCGAWIKRNSYGDRKSDFGWEIDHIKTQANGGGDELGNLRPLHWKNNAAKSDGNLKCVFTASGNKNVEKDDKES